MGKKEEAIAAYRIGLQRCPELIELYNNLGAALSGAGQLDEAVAAYRTVLQSRPDDSSVHNNLANALRDKRQLDQALASCVRALELQPENPQAHRTLGLILHDKGQLDQALAAFQRAIQLKPDYVEAHSNLAAVLGEKRHPDQAIAEYQLVLSLQPNLVNDQCRLVVLLRDQGRYDEATRMCEALLKINPDIAQTHSNLGVLFKDQGRLDESIDAYRQAVAIDPNDSRIHANLLYTLYFHPRFDAAMIAQEHRGWNDRHVRKLAESFQPHENDRDPNRRLRVGYVAADFRDHCQSLFTIPLFSNHDRKAFEIFCYSHVRRPDTLTAQIKGLADHWCDIVDMSDAKLAEQIREDQIDVLVDLTMHMAHSRLLAFARKPGPVQVTWLAYPGTTGMEAIDYRLTDPYLDPPGEGDEFYAERSLRLPDTFWCYDPQSAEPLVNELPALTNGHLTFGCLSNFCKINDQVLDLWAQVLLAVDKSRLILLTPAGWVWDNLLNRFRERGIASDRLERVDHQPRPEYLRFYHRIDIGLDTLPYNGHTTSLDSFWMGVPVITLPGSTVVGRAGFSQLSNLNLSELVADTPKRFVEIAMQLAGDLFRLMELRSNLRKRMQNSPLMDAPRFARNVEVAYRQMWQTWCERKNP
jgi:protein O-GlcNAc transferase